MRIYFSGLGGVGIGPLAEIAHDAGYGVCGSDLEASPMTEQLLKRGVSISYDQSGMNLRDEHARQPIDRFVYTAALPADHPELVAAKALGIAAVKRDVLLGEIVRDKHLKLIAVAGTHGKTTTTGMMIWTMQQLGLPVSYCVGASLSFGPSGAYDPASEYFVYECDEFDRNFLNFNPYVSLLTSIDYDHPDTYPTRNEYLAAFRQFIEQSSLAIGWARDLAPMGLMQEAIWHLGDDEVMPFRLAGVHNRRNATLVAKAAEYMSMCPNTRVQELLATFPGTGRRFERLADNLYSDYGHHPIEIAATLQMAREIAPHITLVYQPHQNIRQHEIRDQYTDCMQLADQIYWLPTYLSREDPNLPILTPEQLSEHLVNHDIVRLANFDDQLWQSIQAARASSSLVLCMGAGSIDAWVRTQLAMSKPI